MRLGPINVDEYNWLYTEEDGLLFVHETYDNKSGAFLQTDQVTVPWHHIRLALAVKDKRKRPRRRKP